MPSDKARTIRDEAPEISITGLVGSRINDVFRKPFVTIGRDEDSDVVLRNPCVSRKHARIVVSKAGAVLRDCNSRYGIEHKRRSIDKLLLARNELYEVRFGGAGGVVLLIGFSMADEHRASALGFERNFASALSSRSVCVGALPDGSIYDVPSSQSSRARPSTWLLALPDGVRDVFRHIAEHGSINEGEATRLLGGARQFRSFSRHLDDYRQIAPFAIRVEVAAGIKCYVRGDR
jgi:hypothetical protein